MIQPDNALIPKVAGLLSRHGVSSPPRQRMTVIATSAAMLGFYAAATDVVLPLWATQVLGLSNSQWAQLRSLRMAGVAAGVIVLGALSDRLGLRRITILSFFIVSLVTVILGTNVRQSVWIVMPLLGAVLSTTMINLNTMTQDVTSRRPGLANTIYRGIGAAAAIPAPAIATLLALHLGGYTPVFNLLALSMAVAAGVLFLYPHEILKPFGTWRAEVRSLCLVYSVALRQRELVRFLVLSQIWLGLLSGILAFAALRFTRDLAMPAQNFGLLSAVAGLMTLLGILGTGIILDRVALHKLFGWLAITAGSGAVLMGASDSVTLSGIGLLIVLPLMQVSMAPTSMWINRTRGDSSQVGAFSLYKVVTALCMCVSTALAGWIEQQYGMRLVFLAEGLIAILLGSLFFFLADPKPTKDWDAPAVESL